jgi:hypothetical protein
MSATSRLACRHKDAVLTLTFSDRTKSSVFLAVCPNDLKFKLTLPNRPPKISARDGPIIPAVGNEPHHHAVPAAGTPSAPLRLS